MCVCGGGGGECEGVSVTEGVVTPTSGGGFSPNSLQSDRGSVYACVSPTAEVLEKRRRKI